MIAPLNTPATIGADSCNVYKHPAILQLETKEVKPTKAKPAVKPIPVKRLVIEARAGCGKLNIPTCGDIGRLGVGLLAVLVLLEVVEKEAKGKRERN